MNMPVAAVLPNKSISPSSGLCVGDGRLAFAMPWSVITALGAASAIGHPIGVFIAGAVIPGLMAGASGLLTYKASKSLLRAMRRFRILKQRLSIRQVFSRP